MSELQPRWREFYQTEARYLRFDPDHDPLENSRVRLVMRLWPRHVISALDIGCGDGYLCGAWQQRGAAREIWGVDYAQARVERAITRVPRGHFSVQTAHHLAFADRQFDLVSLVETLEHLEEPERVLREAARVTRRYVVITVPYQEDLDVHRYTCPYCLNRFHAAGHLSRFDERRVAELFQRAGLRLRIMRIQCYLRIFEEHAVFKWIPTPVVEGVKEWARRANMIHGLYLGALGERLDGR